MKHRYLAEALGTFMLVLVGCGAVASGAMFGEPQHLGISLAFGTVVMAVIYAVGDVSGAHINPAVSVAFWLSGRLEGRALPGYVLAQLFGGVAAAGLLMVIFGTGADIGVTRPRLGLGQSFVLEVVISFILMFVILNVATGHKEKGMMAGIAVGGAVGLLALFAGPATGASMNPARSLGPALLSLEFDYLWIYLVAPVFGACMAVPFCRWVQGPDCCAEDPA